MPVANCNASCSRFSQSVALLGMLMLSACGSTQGTSYAILAGSESFQQVQSQQTNKVDVLWVIDNSGSMSDDQANVANNFQSFIQSFTTKGFDYQIAVAGTDAWRAPFLGNYDFSRFRTGSTVGAVGSGYPVITPSTPTIATVFGLNVLLGTAGSGDERAFSSFMAAFENPQNGGFIRPDSFLAVIILSDEDDFSADVVSRPDRDYSYPGLHTVQSYVNYLDQKTGSTDPTRRKYSVSTISVLDAACQAANTNSLIGVRYMELAALTKGQQMSLCSQNFGEDLRLLSSQIVKLTTQFLLAKTPQLDSLVVTINGAVVPMNPVNGYVYDAAANSIVFQEASAPPTGASVSVNYIPTSL
jgi:hypothetical protein